MLLALSFLWGEMIKMSSSNLHLRECSVLY